MYSTARKQQRYEQQLMHSLTVMHTPVRRHQTIWPTRASCLTWKWLNAKMDIASDSHKQPGESAQIPVRLKNGTLYPFSVLIDWVQNDRLSSSVHWSELWTPRVCLCVWDNSKPSEAEKGETGLQRGAPLDTADEGVHCIVKSPPHTHTHTLHPAPRETSASFLLQKPLSKGDSSVESVLREGPQPSKKRG